MWGFQCHFQIGAKVCAKHVFELLDARLNPQVHLVGVRTEERQHSLPECVEPEDGPWHPKLFAGVLRRAKEIVNAPNSSFWIHPTQEVADHYAQREYRGAVASAILETVQNNINSDQWVAFCSGVREVENYLVAVVLLLDRRAYDSWPTLHRDTNGQYSVTTSLLQATAQEFLSYSADELSKPEPGRNLSQDRDSREIVRTAGKRFGYTPSAAGGEFYGLHTFYDACNVISSMPYEGAAGVGQLVVCRKNHLTLRPEIALASPVLLTDYRSARKMLELASGDLYLFCDSYQIFALGTLAPGYDTSREDLFVIRFTGHHTWELWHGGSALMRVAHNEPRMPLKRFAVEKFIDTINRVLPEITPTDARKMADLAATASDQRHYAGHQRSRRR
jgi:hypothetical protein